MFVFGDEVVKFFWLLKSIELCRSRWHLLFFPHLSPPVLVHGQYDSYGKTAVVKLSSAQCGRERTDSQTIMFEAGGSFLGKSTRVPLARASFRLLSQARQVLETRFTTKSCGTLSLDSFPQGTGISLAYLAAHTLTVLMGSS